MRRALDDPTSEVVAAAIGQVRVQLAAGGKAQCAVLPTGSNTTSNPRRRAAAVAVGVLVVLTLLVVVVVVVHHRLLGTLALRDGDDLVGGQIGNFLILRSRRAVLALFLV